MEFRVLGPLEVVDEGRPVPLDRQRSRALLAYLLLHANEAVSSDRLIDELWGPEPPRTAGASLQNYVSRLRKALGNEVVESRAGGYALRVDPERFDLTRFERLVAEAREAGVSERAAKLRAALALWRGSALADLSFEPFAQTEAARLDELRLSALEDRIAADLSLGKDADLIDELEALVREHPLRERLRAYLMLALYRAGRQADALDAYRGARAALREELGLEPSDELRKLERAILAQDPALLQATTVETAPTESRRTVTVVFCDLVQSTKIATALDPEALRDLMWRYFAIAREAVERHGGVVEKYIGDAVMGIFGAERANEDDALRAVRAAVDIRAGVAALEDDRLAVRIGVNSGEVVVVPGKDLRITGAPVSIGAHLEQRAGTGEIVVGDATRELVRDAVSVTEVDLDGLHAWVLDELVEGAPAVARRFDAPLVGRERELARLRAAVAGVRAEQRCRVVTIVGEAGIGKTRLVQELVAWARDDARVLVGRCASYGEGATYLPLAEIVREVAPNATPEELAGVLDSGDATEVAARIAALAGTADTAAAAGEAFWAVRRFFEALARERPLLVAFDDVHWAEPTLLDLIAYLGEWTSAPMLIVCIARPDLLERRPEWTTSAVTADVVSLEPLATEAIEALLSDLPDDVRERIVERAGGNPLFAEQLRAHVEEAPDERPPATIEALLASRLDRLDAPQLDLIRRAAVIGRRFTRKELADVNERHVRALVDRRLIHPVDDELLRFHHVLVRDVAYNGIPKRDRADLHERLGDRISTTAPDEIVGHHLEQAYRLRAELQPVDDAMRALAERAGDRLAAAGTRAWKRGDAPAAVNLLGRARSLLPPSGARVELTCDLAVATWVKGDVDVAEATLSNAVTEAAAIGDERTELRARVDLANFRMFRAPEKGFDELLELASQAIPVFERRGDDRALGRTWLAVAYVQGGVRCRYAESEDAAMAALRYYQKTGWSTAVALQELVAALYYGPTPVGVGIERCSKLLEQADHAGEANICIYRAGLEAMRGEFAQAAALAKRADDIYAELGWGSQPLTNTATVAADMAMLREDYEEAERVLRASCRLLEEMDDRAHLATQAGQLARVLAAAGEADEAGEWARVAKAYSVPTDVGAQILWRVAEVALLVETAPARAHRIAREAVGLANETDAPNFRAAAALGLGTACHRAGDRRAALESVQAAVDFYERKGNAVAAEHARTLVAEVASI
jgi:DNA-binding SARP family transcriptional activator